MMMREGQGMEGNEMARDIIYIKQGSEEFKTVSHLSMVILQYKKATELIPVVYLV